MWRMQKLLLVDRDRGSLHELTYDLADLGLKITVLDEPGAAVAKVSRHGADIVVVGCHDPVQDACAIVQELQRQHPHVVRLLLGSGADLQAAARLMKASSVFRLIRKPWTTGALRMAIADAKSYSIMQQAASTAIGRVRDMELTSDIRSGTAGEFNPSNTIVLDSNTRIEDLRNFDFGGKGN
jgi:DNA-binding NtrC family response regulator